MQPENLTAERLMALEQGSPEWLAARVGRVTASRVADIMARIKNGNPSAMRATYMGEIVAEQLTGIPTEKYVSGPMQWGSATEDEARAAYCFERLVTTRRVGLVLHPKCNMSAASPDSLVGEDGLLEIKCPNSATHIETLLGRGSWPGKYGHQMQWQMACTGRQWCDFVSYDPRLPESMRLFIERVPRDDAHIAKLEHEVFSFVQEAAAKLGELLNRYPNLETAA